LLPYHPISKEKQPHVCFGSSLRLLNPFMTGRQASKLIFPGYKSKRHGRVFVLGRWLFRDPSTSSTEGQDLRPASLLALERCYVFEEVFIMCTAT
jgi:hypothetical protein